MAVPKFNTVPTPDATIEGLLTSVQALKAVVEQLTGTQGNVAPTRNFYQNTPPAAVITGDTWVRPGVTATDLPTNSVWDGTTWRSQSGSAGGGLAPGMIAAFCGSAAPGGWLFCAGQAVSRATYSALFAVIGVTFGVGDGSTTFNLPDLGGRVIAGKEATASRLTSAGSGVDGATLAAVGGVQNETLTLGQLPSGTASNAAFGAAYSSTGGFASPTAFLYNVTNSAPVLHVQPTIILNMMIKT